MGGEGAGAGQDSCWARGRLGPRGGACSPGSGGQGLPSGVGLVSAQGADVVASGGRAGQGCAVPVRGDKSGQVAGGCASALQHLWWSEEQV